MDEDLYASDIFHRMTAFDRSGTACAVLVAHHKEILRILDRLSVFRAFIRLAEMDSDIPYELYAFSRICDLLVLDLPLEVPVRVDVPTWYLGVSLEQRAQLMESWGLDRVTQTTFHPFYHEIVQVTQSDHADEPISLVSELWPCFMFGDLMLTRAGVHVRGGIQHINKPMAEASTLYFTFCRSNRHAADLSHGWGSNSQWRTLFRRDYRMKDGYRYHADGQYQVLCDRSTWPYYKENPWLTASLRCEVLRHRCYVSQWFADENAYYPSCYSDTYFEPFLSAATTTGSPE